MRVLGLVASYLIGAIPVGFLVARAAGGFDIRGKGSGTIGATNVLRTLGPVPAVLTLLGDIAKGYLAVRVAEVLGPEPTWGAAGALLAVVGNCWPVFLRFRGGKGVATALGAFLALVPKAVLPSAALWIALAAIFRYVSLASMAGALTLPVATLVLGYPRESAGAAGLAALVILWRHRENIRRLAGGTENRLGRRLPAA
ncbi:MAG TPA: glycerol-3-phosphate 1-O-acyltransferase PlsY [Methylomirabilota bacterium]|nr:glycerol-3-phosphate 1-O-acyltransferase PlsY [Methylomirabilota bacterium]